MSPEEGGGKQPEVEEVKEAPDAEAAPPAEPRVEIKIKDFAVYKPCANCGNTKIPYIEIEKDGRAEYICKDCYDAQFAPRNAVKCPSCGSEAEEEDNFCGKCGQRLRAICPQCGAKADPGDKFCRQCGGKL